MAEQTALSLSDSLVSINSVLNDRSNNHTPGNPTGGSFVEENVPSNSDYRDVRPEHGDTDIPSNQSSLDPPSPMSLGSRIGSNESDDDGEDDNAELTSQPSSNHNFLGAGSVSPGGGELGDNEQTRLMYNNDLNEATQEYHEHVPGVRQKVLLCYYATDDIPHRDRVHFVANFFHNCDIGVKADFIYDQNRMINKHDYLENVLHEVNAVVVFVTPRYLDAICHNVNRHNYIPTDPDDEQALEVRFMYDILRQQYMDNQSMHNPARPTVTIRYERPNYHVPRKHLPTFLATGAKTFWDTDLDELQRFIKRLGQPR